MIRKLYGFERCVFCIGFLIGVMLACLLLKSENEKAIQKNCNVRDSAEISYREWFSMKNLKKFVLDYDEISYGKSRGNVKISEAWYLYNAVHVHCIVFVKKMKNAISVKNTWGKRCNEISFYSMENSSDLNNISIIFLKPKSSWQYLCDAIRYLWKTHNENLHWALFVFDDIFAIPENLRFYVAPLDYNKPYYFGHDITFWGKMFNVGDAGYVLSKGTIHALHLRFNSSELCLRSGKYWKNEDFYLGKHLGEMGITPTDTRDNSGCNRFHRYNLNYIMGPQIFKSPSGKSLSKQISVGCYSDSTITFNGIEPDKFYLYDYLLYNVKVFRHGGNLGNHPPSMLVPEDEVWREFLREEGLGEVTDISPKHYFELWQRKIPSPEVLNALLRQQSDSVFNSDDISGS